MRTVSRLALASGGALLLSFGVVSGVNALSESEGSSPSPTSMQHSNMPSDEDRTAAESGTTESEQNKGSNTAEGRAAKARAEAEKRVADAKQKLDQAKTEAEQRRADAKAAVGKKLEATKLRVCQNHEKSIGALMTRIGDRGSRHTELVDTISDRIQAYVTSKQLTVANYDSLLAAIASAKATAATANDAVKAAQPEFKCDGTDPTGAADSFKTVAKARDDAIKAYRDAVKALLVAVKASQAPTTTEGGSI